MINIRNGVFFLNRKFVIIPQIEVKVDKVDEDPNFV